MTRIVVFTENDTELSIDGSSLSVTALADEVSNALKAPGSVMTLHARKDTYVIPVRAIRYVRVEPEETPDAH
jgi:Protein of unknown function (DUF3107)